MVLTNSPSQSGSIEASTESCVLYVGGLPEDTNDTDLRDLLAPFGTVTQSVIVRHRYSGRSAGYGFVHMPSRTQAVTAAGALEGTTRNGRRLRLYISSRAKPIALPHQLLD